ncbi:protein XRI1-like isoform X4 [Juglans microcarpa x Juglans regia]|uniref:protein XRI1-like isoform X4 n=1 Tax=Juglans microcarpa x Juglans regia TaxID=2249226 RepID=UPI001B7F1E70|nr:protein XRI1-like isoform X4 [Juglans microcarpa x Juglans regia]
MDYNNENSESWDWHRKDYCLQKDPNSDISECLWNGVPQNKEDLSYIFDETTPVKACGDLAYHVAHSGNMDKEPEECRESSLQVKRRRMLQFNSQATDPSHSSEERSSAFLKSNEREDSLEEFCPESSYWISGPSGNASALTNECLDQSSEEWLAECFNDTEMNFNTDDVDLSGAPDIQFDIAELCDFPPKYEDNVVQQHVTRTPQKIVFKGRNSFIRTPTKLAASVAYPFAFIKPSGAHGDVTLKEINQRIRTPPPSKSKQGGIHFIMLGAYIAYNKSADQYKWLERDLANVDRSITPWLVAAWHPPWYSSYKAHYREVECMRVAMEELLYSYGVDIVFNGHVHAYERSNRVYNYSLDPCGPVYITVGDGGNREKMAIKYADDPGNCLDPLTTPDQYMGGFCATNFTSGPAAGKFCWDRQPEYSALRESSFGHGILEFDFGCI